MFSRLGSLDWWLKQKFRLLGRVVGRHPAPFIIIPVLLAAFLATGMLGVQYTSDPDELLTPVNGEGRQEKAIAEKFFPTNFSDFDAPRSTKFGLYGYVMVTARDGKSILQPEIWSEVRRLQNIIVDITVEHAGQHYHYADLCAKWAGQCYTNQLLSFADTFAVLSKGVFRDSVENYYRNYSDKFSFEVANNITKLSLETSKDIVNNVEAIKLLTNQTLADIKVNLDVISSAVDGFSDLTNELLGKYKTHLEPSFDGINLPAYFGGITLKNKSIETFDICEIISFMRGGQNKSDSEPCTHPLQLYSAVTDFYQHAEKDVFSSKLLLEKLNREVKLALQQLNLRQSARRLIGLFTNVSTSLEDFAEQVQSLVGEETIDINAMLEAEAVLIGGLLDSDAHPELGVLWEQEFLAVLDRVAPAFQSITVAPLVSNSLKIEMKASVAAIKPILAANVVGMVVFCMAICCTRDLTTSKPWLGLAAVISTLMATFAGFGCLVYAGALFTNFNFGAVFILVGIGLDNAFILLNSWHRTDQKAGVEERLAETMAEAGVSILITSVTDILSFFTAMMAPYMYVKIFCLYTGTSLLLVFLFHVTFFCGCLAVSGRAEAAGRSGLTGLQVRGARYTSCLPRRARYTVTSGQADRRAAARKREEVATVLLGRVIRSGWVRISVLALYISYVAVAIFGICNVQVLFDKTKLINYDSAMHAFVDVEDRLFRDKAFSISVIISGDVNYTDPVQLARIDSLISDLESSTYINEHLSKSWLADFRTVEKAREFILTNSSSGGNVAAMVRASEADFVRSVEEFYRDSGSQYRLDIAYTADRNRIAASRFLIQGQNIHSTVEEERMVTEIREICRRASDESFRANVFNSYFPYTDQYLTIFDQSVQCIVFTGGIVIAVSVLLLPDTVSALSAILSIVSTLTGCLGFMSLWGIVLDGITLINLIMCIGFSVDFSAHFCYHYIDHKRRCRPEEREQLVERTLLSVCKPVLQGAVSTLLGIVGMLYAPSLSFVIFFKMMLIVMTLGVLHSLVLVPILLAFILDVIETIQYYKSASCDSSVKHKEEDNSISLPADVISHI